MDKYQFEKLFNDLRKVHDRGGSLAEAEKAIDDLVGRLTGGPKADDIIREMQLMAYRGVLKVLIARAGGEIVLPKKEMLEKDDYELEVSSRVGNGTEANPDAQIIRLKNFSKHKWQNMTSFPRDGTWFEGRRSVKGGWTNPMPMRWALPRSEKRPGQEWFVDAQGISLKAPTAWREMDQMGGEKSE